MSLNQWFEKGISANDYINAMEKNKEGLLHIKQSFQLPNDEAFFENMKDKNIRAIVLTEDWCGDAMLNIPILLNFAEKIDMEVRMLLRDQNLELMDQYLTNGTARSIPIFIFINEEGEEVAKWGPRASEVQRFVDETRSSLPPKDAADYQEKANELYAGMQKEFQQNVNFWSFVYQSIKSALQKAYQ
ncbi:thioredoxin family protein [Oceanobacillus piezotolerans]|uniref:Thioredoxin family protein n=1 Tax=Oceanobacillus piezotolerans TaxID=2448030 RepID=A0A498DA84_9BACI|nr:thioredoxin family protein [Oceanobacillus piezotolerans]RLL46478.1 thioredoxin family protein [Oceanobacillus piezotolerans]